LDSKSIGKKPVKNLRRFLNIVKIEANNRNRYSKNWFRMGMEGYQPAKLINLPERCFYPNVLRNRGTVAALSIADSVLMNNLYYLSVFG
jgi:hypothetical protein